MREAIRFNRTGDLIRNGIGRWDHASSLDLVYLPLDPGRRPCDCGLSKLTVSSNNLITDNSSGRSSGVHVSAICLLQDREIARSALRTEKWVRPTPKLSQQIILRVFLRDNCLCLKWYTFLKLRDRWTLVLVQRIYFLDSSSLVYCSLTYQICVIPNLPSTHLTSRVNLTLTTKTRCQYSTYSTEEVVIKPIALKQNMFAW